MKTKILVFFLYIVCTAIPSLAADLESRLNGLETLLRNQQKTIEEQQKTIRELRDELTAMKKPEKEAVSVKLPSQEPAKETSGISGLFGGSWMTNPNISLVLNSFFYSSNVNEGELKTRGIAGYSTAGFEQKKGFNLREGELFLFAPVDPYFNLYANIPFNEDGASLEEAYFITTSLPEGFQVKGGKFKSGISRINSQHPHAWDFADPPLLARAFMGNEGIIEKGVQLTYLPRLPFYLHLGIEAMQGENEVLFNRDTKGGPHAFAGFAKASFDTSDYSTVLLGPYAIGGRTRTDTALKTGIFEGNSIAYGFEAVYKWKPSNRRSFLLQGEYVLRNQSGMLGEELFGGTYRFTRSQDGAYIQGLYQMDRWRLGARFDRLGLFAHDVNLAGQRQSFGPNPWRATGALEFNPSEFSRIRLQYNYDRSGPDGRTNNEVFLQLILGIGAHAAHAF